MFNFKANGYDIIDQYYIATYKNLSKIKIEEMITQEKYLIVKEYSNPKFNALLPKDYVFNSQYYIFNGAINDYVQFNEEYFLNFKNNNWSKESIYKTLKSDSMTKYLSLKDKNRFANMPGIVLTKIFYMVALSTLILILLFNWVATPWNNEFIGDDKKTATTGELSNYDKTRFIVKMNDANQIEYNRKEEGNWQKLKSAINVSYILCTVVDTKISYVLISNQSKSEKPAECVGEGVVDDITYPNFVAPLNEFLPENVLARLELDGSKNVNFEEGIKLLSTDSESDFDEPKYVVHKDAKIVTSQTMSQRQYSLLTLSVLPILFGLYQYLKQRKFLSWFNSLKS